MQRHCKRYQKTLIALAMAVLIIALAVVPSFAITPPQPTGETTDLYQGAGNVQETDAEAIVRMIGEMRTLGFFQFGNFVLVGRRGSTTRLFVGNEGYSLTNDGTQFDLVPSSDRSLLEYSFCAGGFSLNVAISTTVTFALTDVLCWWADDTLHVNPDYSYGDAHSDSVINTSAGWHSYYLAVYDYDQNISDAREEGRSAGYASGLEEGDAQGYERGYNDGSADGYNTGYAEGLQTGQANAEERYQQGVVAGQQAGYAEGQTIGYETGYRDGVDDTYPIAYQEGYDDGVAHGGGTTVITEELDIGSIISSIPQAAKSVINGALGFEIFGINVAGTLTAILVVAIVGFVVKWLLSIRS